MEGLFGIVVWVVGGVMGRVGSVVELDRWGAGF